ncbi:hypothetical protein Taro_021225 [Colocasia esculenta]|uniref:Uncharacterized protein n=1 Tax=Colocasia esculenta TaxID=4460 RepID=A0A843UYF5_COLES|nr:hypothetical protein [Colocasia esculenta]
MLGLNVASPHSLSLKLGGHVIPSLIANMLHHRGGLLRMSTLYSQGPRQTLGSKVTDLLVLAKRGRGPSEVVVRA